MSINAEPMSLQIPDHEPQFEAANSSVEESSSLLVDWWQLSPNAKIFAAKAAIIASTGGLLFGYDIGVIEGALPKLEEEMSLSLAQQDTVVSTMIAGAIIGSIMAGLLADRLGRWWSIIITDLTFILGGVILFCAQTPDAILVGRFVVGAAVAVSAVADVSYLSEVAPSSVRGAMVSANELAISVGVLGSFLAGHLLRGVPGGWRWMFGISAALAVVQLCGMLIMPYSPKWLYSRGRVAEAEAVLVRILDSPELVSRELSVMEQNETNAEGSLRELLCFWWKPLMVTTSLAVLQQLTGNANILNYAAEIFSLAGIEGTAPAVWLGLVKVVATIIAILKVDDVGRKPFLFWGAFAFMSSMLLLSFSFAFSVAALSFVSCCLLVAAYSMSFGPVTWLVTAEMFPAAIRGKALGIGQERFAIGGLGKQGRRLY